MRASAQRLYDNDTPAYKDNGPYRRVCGKAADGVAQQFYDYRIQHHSNDDIAALRPSGDALRREVLTDASAACGAPPVDERR